MITFLNWNIRHSYNVNALYYSYLSSLFITYCNAFLKVNISITQPHIYWKCIFNSGYMIFVNSILLPSQWHRMPHLPHCENIIMIKYTSHWVCAHHMWGVSFPGQTQTLLKQTNAQLFDELIRWFNSFWGAVTMRCLPPLPRPSRTPPPHPKTD